MYGEKAFEHGAIVRRGCWGWVVPAGGEWRGGGVKPVSSRLIAARRFHNNFNTPGGNPRISGAYFYKRFWFPEEPGVTLACMPSISTSRAAAEYTRGILFTFLLTFIATFWLVYVVCTDRFNLLNRCSLLDFSCDIYCNFYFVRGMVTVYLNV